MHFINGLRATLKMILLEFQIVLEDLVEFGAFLLCFLLLQWMKVLPLGHVNHARHSNGWLMIYRLVLRFQVSLLIHTDGCGVSIRI
jgi:hypothetical protein